MILFLKHKWFDLIASGEKKEEYREYKPYWDRRIWRIATMPPNERTIEFRRGYTKTAVWVRYLGSVRRCIDDDGMYCCMDLNAVTPEYMATLHPDVVKSCNLVAIECRADWGYEPDKHSVIIRLGEIVKCQAN